MILSSKCSTAFGGRKAEPDCLYLTPKTVECKAHNLPKCSRPTGLRHWKHTSPHWTVCGVALSVHFDRHIASVSQTLHRQLI